MSREALDFRHGLVSAAISDNRGSSGQLSCSDLTEPENWTNFTWATFWPRLDLFDRAQNSDVCRVLDPRRSRLRQTEKVVVIRLRANGHNLLLVYEYL